MAAFIKEKLRELKEWYKSSTQTKIDRLEFAGTALFMAAFGGLGLFVVIMLWQIFLFFFVCILIIVIITSPIWFWVSKGKNE